MLPYQIPGWKTAPFIRLLFPYIIGITIHWYARPLLSFILILVAILVTLLFIHRFFPIAKKFRLRVIQGSILQLIICCLAMFITWNADVRNHKSWFGNNYSDSMSLIIRVNEPLIQKERSFKAEGYIENIITDNIIRPASGKILLYFSRELNDTIFYGDRILLHKPLQPIKNTGNPGAFDYEQYAGFKGIFHSVYIVEQDYVKLPEKSINAFIRFIYNGREHILSVLKKNLSDDKEIVGIAEALLIGYKEDLDNDLLLAYSNTGVVHIIAISGLHLGLIYFILSWSFGKLPFIKNSRLLNVTLVLGCLWLFVLITGSSASVLRSAVMFTCILFGNTFFRHSSIYNSMAASAFMLLCYDPYLLWDVGFQLSYLAVIGIVWLQRPVFRMIYIENKGLSKIWNMMSVTIAAQIAAFPICIYYFHQFPNLFLITNLVAVPLSTLILFAGIFLLCVSWAGIVAEYTGKAIEFLIQVMNEVIKFFNTVPFSVMDNIYSTFLSTWLLYGITGFICAFLLYRNIIWIRISVACMVGFALVHIIAMMSIIGKTSIIVYNIPRSQAIDIIDGERYHFIGDSLVNKPGMFYNFHLKPARISLGVKEKMQDPEVFQFDQFLSINGISIMLIDSAVSYKAEKAIPVDILIISRNPKLKLASLSSAIKPGIVVFDSSNSLWKIAEWKRECTMLLLRFHSVPEQGAFRYKTNS